MPAAFDKCAKEGGRVRTKSLKGDKYMRLCFKGDMTYNGHVKRKSTYKRKGK